MGPHPSDLLYEYSPRRRILVKVRRSKRTFIYNNNNNNKNNNNDNDKIQYSNFESSSLYQSIMALLSYISTPSHDDVHEVHNDNNAKDDDNETTTTTTNKDTQSLLFSKRDVIGLLLPWTVQVLVYYIPNFGNIGNNTNDNNTNNFTIVWELVWRILAQCLDLLMTTTAATTSTNNSNSNEKGPKHKRIKMSTTSTTSTSNSSISNNKNGIAMVRNEISSILTQNVLHRIINMAAQLAFGLSKEEDGRSSTSTSSTSTLAKSASKCYAILVPHFYRPTIDSICMNLLTDVTALVKIHYDASIADITTTKTITAATNNKSNNNNNNNNNNINNLTKNNNNIKLPEHEYAIIETTLHLLNQFQNNTSKTTTNSSATAKKIFSLLSNETVLNSLSLLYRCSSSCSSKMEDNEDDNESEEETAMDISTMTTTTTATTTAKDTSNSTTTTRDIINSILWDGLYTIESKHMDGFRIYNRLFLDLDLLSKTSSPSNKIESSSLSKDNKQDDDDDDDDDKNKSKNKKKNNNKETKKKNTTNIHYSYQQNLVSTIQHLVSGDDDNNSQKNNNNTSPQKNDSSFRGDIVIPSLMEGFIIKTRDYEDYITTTTTTTTTNNKNDNHIGGTSNSPTAAAAAAANNGIHNNNLDIVKLQFRFGMCIIQPFLTSLLDDQVTMAATANTNTATNTNTISTIATPTPPTFQLYKLRTIQKCLALMVQHTIYHPSQMDDKNQHYIFLKHIGETLLQFLSGSSSGTTLDHLEKIEIMGIFQHLLMLNHHIVDKHLSQIIQITCYYLIESTPVTATAIPATTAATTATATTTATTTTAATTTTTTPNDNNNDDDNDPTTTTIMLHNVSTNFLTLIIETYQKLRQLKYFFYNSFIQSLLVLEANMEEEGDLISSTATTTNTTITAANTKNNNRNNNNQRRSSKVQIISSILKNNIILNSITQAIQVSPIGDIINIWNMLNESIPKLLLLVDDDDDDTKKKKNYNYNYCQIRNENVQFMVQFFIIIIQAIDVHPLNANPIQDLVEHSSSSMYQLLWNGSKVDDSGGSSSSNIMTLSSSSSTSSLTSTTNTFDLSNPLTNYGLLLCGWILEIHTKCCFYLNNSPESSLLSQPSSCGGSGNNNDINNNSNSNTNISLVSALMNTVEYELSTYNTTTTTTTTNSNNQQQQLGAIHHLCFYRLQQLHSMIYQQEQLEVRDDLLLSIPSSTSISGSSSSSISSSSSSNMDTTTIHGKEKNLKSQEMIKEAKLLVTFIFHAVSIRFLSNGKDDLDNDDLDDAVDVDVDGDGNVDNYNSKGIVVSETNHASWKGIARNVAIWSTYCEVSHIQAFLKYIFYTLAITPSSLPSPPPSPPPPPSPILDATTIQTKVLKQEIVDLIVVEPFQKPIPISIVYEERLAALMLLQDASFFEVNEVFDQCILVAFSCAIELIRFGLTETFGGNNDDDDSHLDINHEEINLLSSPLNSKWTPLKSKHLTSVLKVPDELLNYIDENAKIMDRSSSSHKMTEFLNRVLKLLVILKDICFHNVPHNDVRMIIDFSLRIHLVMHYLLGIPALMIRHIVNVVVKIIEKCRVILSQIFANFTSEERSLFTSDEVSSIAIVTYMFQSSIEVFTQTRHNLIVDKNEYLTKISGTGGDVLAGCLLYMSRSNESMQSISSFFDGLDKTIQQDLPQLDDETELLLKVSFLRPSVNKLICYCETVHSNRQQNKKMILIYTQLSHIIKKNVFESILKCVKQSLISPKPNETSFSEMALFCVEAMRLFTMTGVDTASSQIINNHSNQIMFRDLFNFATSLGDDFFERDISVMYILCSIPLSELFTLFQSFDVTKKIQELILHLFIQKGGMVCPLLKSLVSVLSSCNNDNLIIINSSIKLNF